MNKFSRLKCYIKLLPRLGFYNAFAVARYRRRWRNGSLETTLPAGDVADSEPFWQGGGAKPALTLSSQLAELVIARADALCAGKFQRFGDHEIDEGLNPEWHKAVYAQSATQHFTHIRINAVAGEDIKLTWDLSRMHWAPRLALAACITTGDARQRYLARLNHLSQHWLAQNPYQRGANWACAHEVSVRGMQLMLSSIILQQHLGLTPSRLLLKLMEKSWQRVYEVRGYARAQHNNHSLAEHLFLVYAAAFLKHYGIHTACDSTVTTLQRQLMPLVDGLIMADGGSVMYSTNYHRVFCDMLSIGKLFDDAFALGLYADASIQKKSRAAFDFLDALVEPISGHMPLIGHNDGSLHCLQYSGFHDAQPSLLFMAAAFGFAAPARLKRAEGAAWLFDYSPEYTSDATITPQTLRCFDNFGLAVFSNANYRAYVKYPRNQFRPVQLDFLHLDVWAHGINMLHDSGTYSYNPPVPSPCDDVSDASAHNAPALVGVPSIPKLSPFLYAFWPNAKVKKASDILEINVPLMGGNSLHRRINFTASAITLTDHVRSAHAWQVTFNGTIITADKTTATLGNAATMRFDNTVNLSITETMHAPNYLTLAASKRLVAAPRDAGQPITTTLTFTA